MAYSHATSAATTLVTPTIIAKEALMHVANNMVMGRLVHREYKNEFNKVGSSINLRKPVTFSATEATKRTNTSIVEYAQAFTVTQQVHVSWGFTSTQLTQTVDEYSKRYIQPAALALANYVDVDLCDLYNQVAQFAGTPGTTPNTYGALGDCQTILDNAACPEGRVAVLDPNAHWAMADGLKGTFAQKPVNDIHTKGYLGTVAGLDIHKDQNIARHLCGDYDVANSTPINKTALTAGAYQMDMDNWDTTVADALNAGDVFTIGNSAATNVYAVNPVSGVSTGVLYQFVALNDEAVVTTECTADIFLSTSQGCQITGQYKNMSIFPATGAVVNFVNGTENTYYPQNLIFHPNAFGLVVMPLAMPAGVWGSRVTDKQTALSIRIVKDYEIYYDEEIIRMDILYGVSALHPHFACRLTG